MRTTPEAGKDALDEAENEGKITSQERKAIEEKVEHPAKHIATSMNIKQLAKAIEKVAMTDAEKRDVYDAFYKKVDKVYDELSDADQIRYTKLLEKLRLETGEE